MIKVSSANLLMLECAPLPANHLALCVQVMDDPKVNKLYLVRWTNTLLENTKVLQLLAPTPL